MQTDSEVRLDILVFWVIASIVVGVIANSRGRFWIPWMFLALLITPLLAGLLVLVLPSKKPGSEQPSVVDGTGRKCPMCAETVRAEAVKCRFCGADLEPKYAINADTASAQKYGG